MKLRERNLSRIKDLEKEKVVFEFETLKSQVNPHFLFNSFSTLSSIIEENSDLAVEYVQRLSDFFRSILENRDKDLILLSDELQMINNYIEIQKSRFGEALLFSNNIPETAKDSMIPPLVIQLLIENAIKHNVISSARPLNIIIDLSAEREIVIKNNLQPKRKKEASTGLGLENIKQRYLLVAQKEICIVKTEKYFTVKLPLI
jgi:LytS/YehU family sensor histidine kinase